MTSVETEEADQELTVSSLTRIRQQVAVRRIRYFFIKNKVQKFLTQNTVNVKSLYGFRKISADYPTQMKST